MSSPLEVIVADLEYAAGPGAARLVAGTIAQGRTDAEIGAALARPTPVLTQLLARAGHAATTTEGTAPIGAVAETMAVSLAEGGAELAIGKRP